ncbi:MAG TPA: NAD(P)-dependent oxidoreductase [Acidimicrobiales bacterium]|nr:NAD(P)-dependent oxidoreductase [Acidimicrobiales bacterium]
MMPLRHQEEPPLQVAVIGTGTMGAAMARRLLDSGMEVGVWSRHPSSMMPLVDLRATAYADAADAARDADVVISMLPTAKVTADVMLADQTLQAMRPGAIWLQMATIGVRPTERLATYTRQRRTDVAFVDAPVSGAPTMAETGQLVILPSGPEAVEPSLEPLFGLLGTAAIWLGPAGAGSRMKLILNKLVAFHTQGEAEVAALAGRLGVASPSLFAAMRDNPLAAKYAVGQLAGLVDRDYHPDYALDWAMKDLNLLASAVAAAGTPSPWPTRLGEVARQRQLPPVA